MGIKISEKFLNDLTTKLIKAADGGQKLGVTDPDEVGQYVCSVLALGCELIPVIGSSLSALTTLLGSLFFHPNATEKIWEKLRERIEALVDTKITETQMDILRKKIRGLQDNIKNYTQKDAYSDLAVPASEYARNEEGYDDLDYTTYAYKVYRKGRGQVKPYHAELNDADNRGSTAAATLRAYADYDSSMVINVLNYVEYWPYLAGDKMPEPVLKRLDLEIFFGLFGRHTTNAI
ncbi:hypothetical protein FOBRF1_000036 [Fusarium oxysporum]